MTALISIIDWAVEHACSLLEPLGQRWIHVQGVAEKAKQVSAMLDKDDQEILIAAAYLHDIGYAPSLQKTGFHPLDGAYHLQDLKENRLASLVAYHSGAQFEAQLRGLTPELNQFNREQSIIADALDYCDMTTNSIGLQVTFQERIDEIFSRYDKTHIVNKAIHQAIPSLSLAVQRTKEALLLENKMAKSGKAPKGYYSASQTMRRLKIGSSTLYHFVEVGKIKRIVPPNMKEGYYLQEDVDTMAQERELFFQTFHKEQSFAPTEEDNRTISERLDTIEKQLYEQKALLSQILERFPKNPR